MYLLDSCLELIDKKTHKEVAVDHDNIQPVDETEDDSRGHFSPESMIITAIVCITVLCIALIITTGLALWFCLPQNPQ